MHLRFPIFAARMSPPKFDIRGRIISTIPRSSPVVDCVLDDWRERQYWRCKKRGSGYLSRECLPLRRNVCFNIRIVPGGLRCSVLGLALVSRRRGPRTPRWSCQFPPSEELLHRQTKCQDRVHRVGSPMIVSQFRACRDRVCDERWPGRLPFER
jgi:hypothetical protein